MNDPNSVIHKFLLDEEPLIVLPSLARVIGLNEAIFIQQLHYWLRKSKHNRDGRKWVFNTYENWLDQFKFWSLATLRRVIGTLEERKLVLTTDLYNRSKSDKTKWYSIDYEALAFWVGDPGAGFRVPDDGAGLLKSTDGLLKMSSGTAQNEQIRGAQNEQSLLYQRLPETTPRELLQQPDPPVETDSGKDVVQQRVDAGAEKVDWETLIMREWRTRLGYSEACRLVDMAKRYGKARVQEAVEIASLRNRKSVGYVCGILEKPEGSGLDTAIDEFVGSDKGISK